MSADDSAEMERILGEIWKDVLQRADSVAGSDRFFELGGDSVSMMMMLFRVEQLLHVEIAPEQVFEDDSLSAMISRIDALRASSAGSPRHRVTGEAACT